MSCPEHKTPGPLIEGKFLPGGYQQESNRKNNICKRINIPEQHYYVQGDLRLAEKTCLVGPFIQDLINKKNNKSDADEKIRAPEEVAVLVRDHKVDLIDTAQYGKKGIKETEVRGKRRDITQNEVFIDPGQNKHDQDNIKEGFF